jgi:hypothetical protein
MRTQTQKYGYIGNPYGIGPEMHGLFCAALPYFGATKEAFCAVFLVGSHFLICSFELTSCMLTGATTFFRGCRVYAK